MSHWLRKFLGQVCCPRTDEKPEWTPWEKKEKILLRPVRHNDYIRDVEVEEIEILKIWQERQCTTCGKFQQKKLSY